MRAGPQDNVAQERDAELYFQYTCIIFWLEKELPHRKIM